MELLKSFGIVVAGITFFALGSAGVSWLINWLVLNMSVEVALGVLLLEMVAVITTVVHVVRMSNKGL